MTSHSRRAFLAASGALPLLAQRIRRLNVLFVAVDDLRPDFGAYGNPNAVTPSLDGLASTGMLFRRAYCQQAVCSPSRTSLLTGRRPDTTRVYELQTHFRKTIPDAVTLPQHFRLNGYTTAGLGKIFHNGLEDPQSWSIPHWFPGSETPAWNTSDNAKLQEQRWSRLQDNGLTAPSAPVVRAQRGPSWLSAPGTDSSYADGQIADAALSAMETLQGDPFFLAVGFTKPHLPFVAPSKYFDLYAGKKFALPARSTAPIAAPALALHNSGELRHYNDIPESGPVSAAQQLDLIRAYYASMSYMDAQLGRMLDGLRRLGLEQNTVVVLWGDHGYHLGDLGLWNKHTNFERAAWSPLMVRVPGMRNSGGATSGLTEFVDIYPSLAAICGLPEADGLEGTSFAPLLDNPDRSWKRAAFSQYPRGKRMGYSMRTERWRYTQWRDADGSTVAEELYDHAEVVDPSINLAPTPAYAPVMHQHREWLAEGWRPVNRGARRPT